jgi:MinD superfamily P-loop ATPase
MIIAVAGGKGGTGKTLVSTSLAVTGGPLQFLDCDVEEPNGHLFLSPRLDKFEKVTVTVPRFRRWKGRACREGAEFCRPSALAVVRDEMLVFPELCTSCGGCFMLCPDGALTPFEHPVGTVKCGTARAGIDFVAGELFVGQQRTADVVRAVKEKLRRAGDAVIDCPPGSGPAAMEAVRGSTLCILVTEPTPFGLHDLAGNKKLLDILGIPCAVVVNRAGGAYEALNRWCREEGLTTLLEIPCDAAIARGAARGRTLPEIDASWRERLRRLWVHIRGVSGARS